MKIVDMIGSRVAYPFLFTTLSVYSEFAKVKSVGKSAKVLWESEYDGRNIAVVALFQKGAIRPDIYTLLKALSDRGCYVIAVNTLRTSDAKLLKEVCNCYIERNNFGRDFGSYKDGFLHIFRRGWENSCPRLIMANDSIYYIGDKLPAFLDEMLASEIEALGSTENFEIVHHLGSFFITLSGSVIRHSVFRQFWKRYRNSDVRPVVIHRGEQNLSKVLRRCVSAPTHFDALYGANRFLNRLKEDALFIDDAIKNARRSDLTGWKRLLACEFLEYLRENFVIRSRELPEEIKVEIESARYFERKFAGDFKGIVNLAGTDLGEESVLEAGFVRSALIGKLTEVFMSGSQIHQNAAILVNMGLPFVKLDGLYRGMFTIEDISMITGQLPESDALALQKLLLMRPYGGDVLRGLRRAAFMRGLI